MGSISISIVSAVLECFQVTCLCPDPGWQLLLMEQSI